jgi:hypothetical protein
VAQAHGVLHLVVAEDYQSINGHSVVLSTDWESLGPAR